MTADPLPVGAASGPRGPRRLPTLRGRLVVWMAVVAVVAILATLLAGYQLVRISARDGAQRALADQAVSLAASAPATRSQIVQGLSAAAQPSVLVATISPAGAVDGSAAGLVSRAVVRQVLAGRSVSTTVAGSAGDSLVEARPTTDGGGVVVIGDLTRSAALERQIALRLLLALAIGLVVAVVAALIVGRAVTRPLRRLRDDAARIAAGARDVAPASGDVAEVVEAEQAMAALADALARSEARQREFLLSISHDLRTPLTAIGGYAEALADCVVPPDQIATVGATLRDETARLGAFTADLLALARLEADDFGIQPGPVDVSALLRATVDAWSARAAAGDVVLAADGPAVLPATVDGGRLRQLLDGLVENALRASASGTRVDLACGLDAGRIWVEVADRGAGITEQDAADAFERGMLRERYREVRAVGTGLGLSIAARLVRRLGGTIAARPRPAGGAVFRIELPAG